MVWVYVLMSFRLYDAKRRKDYGEKRIKAFEFKTRLYVFVYILYIYHYVL